MICFIFPGQGSQREGMGKAWVDHPSWELVEEASQVTGRDMEELLCEFSSEQLSITRNTQLATFLLSMVALDSIERLGISPQLCAGHSLGEYAALVAAGVVAFDAALRLVSERSEAMQSAAEESPGAMAALLGVEDGVADDICQRIDAPLWVANYNSAGQVVIAGSEIAIALASEAARARGVRKVVRIPVGGAFHTPLMEVAVRRLSKALDGTRFYDAEIPVIANVDAKEHFLGREWSDLLKAQLTSPVRWHQTTEHIAQQHPNLLVEVGPGGVLQGLMKRALPEIPCISVAAPDDLDTLIKAVTKEGPLHKWAISHHGEHLFTSERLVVSPAQGIFYPAEGFTRPEGSLNSTDVSPRGVAVGDLIGCVGEVEIRSPFRGQLKGAMAMEGERVTVGQPIAWLETEGN